jgi:hypothetical protein
VWENIIIEQSQWFEVNENQTYKMLNYVFENQLEVKNKAASLMYSNRDKFTLNKMTKSLGEIMKTHTKSLPEAVSIKLPKLKKINSKLEAGGVV